MELLKNEQRDTAIKILEFLENLYWEGTRLVKPATARGKGGIIHLSSLSVIAGGDRMKYRGKKMTVSLRPPGQCGQRGIVAVL